MMPYNKSAPEWILGEGPESDVVISTRARLARSLAAYPFPSRLSGEDSKMVVQEVKGASVGLTNRFPGLKMIDMDRMDAGRRDYLLDAHLISYEQTEDRPGTAVLLEPAGILSIMVNEEDHLRIQVIKSGLVAEEVWEMADWADDVLSADLRFGYSSEYGYLTADVSNVGTGLRISAMMHLVGLAWKNRIVSQLRAAYDLGVSVRGLFGEASLPVGDFYQVSNEITLGFSEREIVQRVDSVAQYLLREERIAREELVAEQRDRLVDQANKALEVLRHSRSISSEKAITLMSPVRLAASTGLIKDCSPRLLNELLVGMRVNVSDGIRAGIERAELLRNELTGFNAG